MSAVPVPLVRAAITSSAVRMRAGTSTAKVGRERFEVLGGARHERQAGVQHEPRDPLGAGLEAREHRVRVTELRGFRPVAVAHGSTRLLGFPSARERRS